MVSIPFCPLLYFHHTRRQLRDELVTNDTDLPIKVELFQAIIGSGGDIKPDRRAGSFTKQDFAQFRIITYSTKLEKVLFITLEKYFI